MEKLGETIKFYRQKRGLTQPQLAELLGVSNGVISMWKNNVNEPNASYIKALCSALSVSADTLLGLTDND